MHQREEMGVNSKAFTLERDDSGLLVLTVEGKVPVADVRIVRAAPLSFPDRHITFLDAKGRELHTLASLMDLPPDLRRLIEEELANYYLGSIVRRIHSLESEFGIAYWDVETSRGRRDFVMQDIHSSATWLSPNHVLLVDVDGNRFEIPDVSGLDQRSQRLMEATL